MRSRRALPGCVGCHGGAPSPRCRSLELSHLGRGRDSSSPHAQRDTTVPQPGRISLCRPPRGTGPAAALLAAARTAFPSPEGRAASSGLGPPSASTSRNPAS